MFTKSFLIMYLIVYALTIHTYANYLDDCLIENRRRDDVADQHKLRPINKAAATFDPLTTHESDDHDITLDLLAEKSEWGALVNKSRAKSCYTYTDTVAILEKPSDK
jgi:hypothetical protein